MIGVGAVDGFIEGAFALITAGKRRHELGILRWHGRFFAVSNRCPHHGGPLCAGGVTTALLADCLRIDGEDLTFGGLRVEEDSPVVVCPWHHWEFVVSDGTCLADPRVRARTYRTTVVRGHLFVDVG
jgi:nitrite reductase (NADH) small subunit